jgi:hypothetical protein
MSHLKIELTQQKISIICHPFGRKEDVTFDDHFLVVSNLHFSLSMCGVFWLSDKSGKEIIQRLSRNVRGWRKNWTFNPDFFL